MFTSKDGNPEHTHQVEVDGNGNGETVDTSDGPVHDHEIKNYKALAGGEDSHTHTVESENAIVKGDDEGPTVTEVGRKSMKDAIQEKMSKGDLTTDKKGKPVYGKNNPPRRRQVKFEEVTQTVCSSAIAHA